MLNTRKFVLASALVAVSAGIASAAPVKDDGSSTAALISGNTIHNEAATGLSTGFESPFVPGTLNAQQGWGVSTLSSVPVTSINVVNTTPIADAQSIRLVDTTTAANGSQIGAFSPVSVQSAPDASITSFKLRIDGVTPGAATGGADYRISAQSPEQAFVTWRVNFSYLGTIQVTDYPGVGQTGTLGFQNTGATWTPGTTYDVSVAFLPSPTAVPGATGATGSIVYSLNGVPIYTADSLVAGTKADQYVVLTDSWQVAGESGTFDNLVVGVVPEPTSLAALALGGMVLRRRRA